MVSIKKLELQDIVQAVRLSNAEKWNQTEKDWELLIQNPQNICLAAVDGDRIIGTATAINYANDVAWIGMVLVDQEYRGRKVSKLLLAGLFEKLGSCRSLKLDATPAGQPVYQKYGFKDEYLIHRMTASYVFINGLQFDSGVLPERAYPENIPEIIEYDKRVFGADRKQLIGFLIGNCPDNAWMLRQEGQITGIALGRRGSRFFQIGPVLASTTEDAKKLISKSLRGIENQAVAIDILDDKKELMDWLCTIGFTKQRHFVRMFQNENIYPGIPKNEFLICGPEFG
jgi:GNAT superfamily N-acetyltransferase